MKTNSYIKITMVILAIIIAFHLLLIVKLIPYNIAWGGRLKNDHEMYAFETISNSVNLFLIWILLVKGNYLRFRLNEKLINTLLWIFFFIFILNTIGNLLAETYFEKGFSVVTLILALLIWKVVNKKIK